MMDETIGKWMNENCERCKLRGGDCESFDDVLLGYFGFAVPEKTVEFIGSKFTESCPHKEDKEAQ